MKRAVSLCATAMCEDDLHEIVIRPYKVDLSDQQRKLYWVWVRKYIAPAYGYEDDEMHLELKKKFLINIFTREHESFAEMVNAVAKVKKDDPETWRVLAAHILKKTSIMDAKMKEMSEYMTKVDRFVAGDGIRLPLPEDKGYDKRVWKR